MPATMTFDESLALTLYHTHKTDSEIERTLGKKPGTIASWRKRRHLPSIASIKRSQDGSAYQMHQNFHDVLTLEQSKEMNRFLRALSFAGRKAVEVGVKPDVGNFINVYCGRTKSEEEWKQERLWMARERRTS